MPPGASIPDWISIIANGGSATVVAFVVWYLLSKHLPSLMRSFTESITKQEEAGKEAIKSFLDTLKHQAEMFRGELQLERQTNAVNLEKLLKAIEEQNRLLLYLAGQARGQTLSDEEKTLFGVKPV
jgi:hypothetical protein